MDGPMLKERAYRGGDFDVFVMGNSRVYHGFGAEIHQLLCARARGVIDGEDVNRCALGKVFPFIRFPHLYCAPLWFQDKRFFCDTTHLNHFGAMELSRRIAVDVFPLLPTDSIDENRQSCCFKPQ